MKLVGRERERGEGEKERCRREREERRRKRDVGGRGERGGRWRDREGGVERWREGTNWFSISRRREQRERVKRLGQEIKVYFSSYLPPSTFLSSPLLSLFSLSPQRREKGKMRVHKLQNVQTALNFLQNEKKVSSPDTILALTQD